MGLLLPAIHSDCVRIRGGRSPSFAGKHISIIVKCFMFVFAFLGEKSVGDSSLADVSKKSLAVVQSGTGWEEGWLHTTRQTQMNTLESPHSFAIVLWANSGKSFMRMRVCECAHTQPLPLLAKVCVCLDKRRWSCALLLVRVGCLLSSACI